MRPTFNRLVMVLFFADLLATQLALLIVPWLRVQLPFGLDLELAVAANPSGLALLAGVSWSASLWLLGAYEPATALCSSPRGSSSPRSSPYDQEARAT